MSCVVTKIFVFTFWRNVLKIHCSIFAKSFTKENKKKMQRSRQKLFFPLVLNYKRQKLSPACKKTPAQDVHIARQEILADFCNFDLRKIM
jgi:hypothetical protein